MTRRRKDRTPSSGTPAPSPAADPPQPAASPQTPPAGDRKESPRRRWTLVDSLLTAALAASLVALGWQIYRTYLHGPAAEDLPPPTAGDLCHRLQDQGDVLALGRDALPACELRGARLLTPNDLTPDGTLERLLSGRDDDAVARLLEQHGVRHVVVSPTLANPSLLPKVTVRNRLALYKPSERFHALYLSEAAGLYETIPGWPQLTGEEGAELVRLARATLAGLPHEPPPLPALTTEGDHEVLVQLQGLKPIARDVPADPESKNSKPYTQHIRPALFAGGRGRTLIDATKAAAAELAERYRRRYESREGPLPEALARLTVEVEVAYDFTDVYTAVSGKPAETRYRSFLWRAIDLGLHGVALDRDTPRYQVRPPSDAVYAGRKDVEDLLARACRDYLDASRRALDAARKLADRPQAGADELSKTLYRLDPRLRVQRFRAHHFRETRPGGDSVVRLSRGIPPLPPTRENLSRRALRDGVYWATRWLVENLQPDGAFRYLYRPELDYYLSDKQVVEQYNEVRHGLASYSLFMSHQEVPSPELWEAAERSLRWNLERVVFGPAWTADPVRRTRLPPWVRTDRPFGPPKPGGGTGPADRWRCPHGDLRPIPPEMAYVRHLDNAKMGAVAAAVLAVSEKIYQTPADRRDTTLAELRPFLEGFASFLLFMQHTTGDRAGSFDHYFVSPEHGHYRRSTTIYPGEILFALSRIYRLTGDPRIPPAFALAVEYERNYFDRESAIREPDGTYENQRRADLVQFVPWISMAMNDMALAVRDDDPRRAQEYAEFGIRVSEWVADVYLFDPDRTFFPEYLGGYFKWEFELPAMHSMVYAEGTAAAAALAKRFGDPRFERMRSATVLGCRFALQQIVVPGRNDHFLPNPGRARGGVRFGINNSEMRTDYSYHTLSALNQTLRYLTDEELVPP
ncbi:MAG: hypothetical protein GYA57_03565 [Myxococcales bacterium]|nr:hypothetical protein [Myxococcales bacterium]